MLLKEQRIKELLEFIHNAKSEDWDIVVVGQRVQVIKGTEIGRQKNKGPSCLGWALKTTIYFLSPF
jgi:L-2-hydroxyglutarate oxidase LhgO